MRRILFNLAVLLTVIGIAAPAGADGYVDAAANALRGARPVFVAEGADPSLTEAEANAIRDRITAGNVPIYVAVLPDAAGAEVGGHDNLPQAIGQRMGGGGVWAVVSGKRFRAGSSDAGLGKGQAGQLATLALQSHRPAPSIAPMLLDFVDRVQAAVRSKASGGARIGPAPAAKKKSNAGAVAVTILLVLLGVAVLIGLIVVFAVLWRDRVRKREEREEFEQRMRDARARYDAVADDVLILESQVRGNAKARSSLSEATSAYNRAGTVLDSAVTAADADSANTDLARAENAVADARAYLEGRDPVAERKAAEEERAARERESARLAAERREQEERERREREEWEAKVNPDNYQPRERRSSTYNHRFEGGYYGGVYYAPGYYSDPFWNYVMIDAIMDGRDHSHGERRDDHHDSGSGHQEQDSYASVSADTGGDWSSTDSGGGGDWGGSSSSSDFGGGGYDSGGGGDFGGGDSGGSSSGGGDW